MFIPDPDLDPGAKKATDPEPQHCTIEALSFIIMLIISLYNFIYFLWVSFLNAEVGHL
jgi:hypothetical protein